MSKKEPKNKPVVLVGWPTIARLARGETVVLGEVVLMPDSLLANTARQIDMHNDEIKAKAREAMFKCPHCGATDCLPDQVELHAEAYGGSRADVACTKCGKGIRTYADRKVVVEIQGKAPDDSKLEWWH